jgi:hypothetical protein
MTSWKITWRLPRRKERKSVKAKACTKAQRRKGYRGEKGHRRKGHLPFRERQEVWL